MTMRAELLKRIIHRSGRVTYAPSPRYARTLLPRFRHALKLAGPLTGLAVADVGCWTGDLLQVCRQAGATALTGVDLNGPWLAEARRRVPSATLVQVAALPELAAVALRPVDVIFCLETLEHLPRGTELASLRTLVQILKPGGRLVLSTPAAGVAAIADPAWLLVGHRHYRSRTAQQLALDAGLEPYAVFFSGDLRESLDIALFYFNKHLLRRPYRSPRILASAGERLRTRRRFDACTVWLCAVRPQGEVKDQPA